MRTSDHGDGLVYAIVRQYNSAMNGLINVSALWQYVANGPVRGFGHAALKRGLPAIPEGRAAGRCRFTVNAGGASLLSSGGTLKRSTNGMSKSGNFSMQTGNAGTLW